MIAVVDWDALLEVLWSAALAGVGVTAVFGIAIVGATRAIDLRNDDNAIGAAIYAAVGLVAIAAVAATIVFGIVVMTQK